jgi:HEAT repeat protein
MIRVADLLVDRVEHDSDPIVRSAAVSVLGKYVYEGLMLSEEERHSPLGTKVRKVNEYLATIFRDPDKEALLRRRAVESLAFNPTREIEDIIREWSKSEDDLFRKSSAFAMGRLDKKRFSRILINLLDDPSARVRTETIRSIGEQGITRAITKLVAMIEKDSRDIALEAIQALGQIGGKKAEKELLRLAQSADLELARYATETLDELVGI